MASSSRLVQYERKQALKSAFLYILLTAVILYGLSRFGTQVVTSVTGIVNSNKTDNTGDNSAVVAPPRLNNTPEITNQKTITLEGSAPSGETIRLTLNGETQDIVANSQGSWTTGFSLHEGQNTFKAVVVDPSGNVSQEVASVVTLDTTAPTLTITAPEEGSSRSGKKEQQIQITGTTDADSSIKVGDRIAIVSGNGSFTITMGLSDGENEFTIVATDRAGNTTQEVRHVTYTP